jgi:hypothetical protein
MPYPYMSGDTRNTRGTKEYSRDEEEDNGIVKMKRLGALQKVSCDAQILCVISSRRWN